MVETAYVATDGADIYYDYEGSGPLLLMIAGGGGDGERYSQVSEILADEYKVVRYDRRCSSRSSGDREAPLKMTQQASDAVAIIQHLNETSAFVFGNSGGANIALSLLETHPESVQGLVVHEPPLVDLLPDAKEWQMFGEELLVIFADQGTMPAMMKFWSTIKGISGPPGNRSPNVRNLEFLLSKEIANISSYSVDIEKLKATDCPIVAVAGEASDDAYYARAARILAERLDCPYKAFSGHHLSFATDPADFAKDLREALNHLKN